MKKIILTLCAAVLLLEFFAVPTVWAKDEKEKTPLYAEDLKEGTYEIEVDSSSSMFRVVGCALTVSGGKMTAVITLSGTGYEKLFMGTGEEAAAAGDEEYIYYQEDEEGKYTYAVPVEALDQDIDCAAWSIRKERWYDRVLVFRSDGLPKEALAGNGSMVIPIVIAAAVVVVIAAAGIGIAVKKKKNQG